MIRKKCQVALAINLCINIASSKLYGSGLDACASCVYVMVLWFYCR